MNATSTGTGQDIPDAFFFTFSAVSCAFFILVFYMSPWFSSLMWQGYRHLPRSKQIDFDSRTGSSIHAAIVSVSSLCILLFDEQLANPVWGDSPRALLTCSIVLGYMMADLLLLCWYYDDLWELSYVAHHLPIIFVECTVIMTRRLAWFTLYRHVSEMSTPFINQRFCLDAVGYGRQRPLFIINGLIMTMLFFIVRVASIPIFYYKCYCVYASGDYVQLGWLWHALLYPGMVLDILNVVWFRKILQGAMRVLFNSGKHSNISQQKTD